MTTYISVTLIILAVGIQVRNRWVSAMRTELNRFEGGVHLIYEYADYDTMMLRFWVWDIRKFKTPNEPVKGRAESASSN